MYESLGLARDPFSNRYDAYLHVAPPGSARAGKAALTHLSAGRSLWVKGAPGSGRESFLSALAENLAESNPVITVESGGEAATALSSLHAAISKGLPPNDAVSLAEEVYERLFAGFGRGLPVIVFTRADSVGMADLSEIEIIADLQFMGRKIATVAACGEGEAPPFFEASIELATPQPEALAEMVRARLGLCGGAGLLEEEAERIGATAAGFSDALRLASLSLGRLRFERFGSVRPHKEPVSTPSLFSADALGEVGRLLDEISTADND